MFRADNLTTFMWRMSLNLGASTALKPSERAQACNGIVFTRKIILRSMLRYPAIHFVSERSPYGAITAKGRSCRSAACLNTLRTGDADLRF